MQPGKFRNGALRGQKSVGQNLSPLSLSLSLSICSVCKDLNTQHFADM